jgi:transcriptional regulator with PAS, ATPase and Fis domain
MGKQVRGLTEKALETLLNHPFPGNVRELQNVLEHAMILCKGVEIQPPHLPNHLLRSQGASTAAMGSSHTGRELLRSKEKEGIEELLRRNEGRIGAAAREMGVHRSTLWRKMKRLGIAL